MRVMTFAAIIALVELLFGLLVVRNGCLHGIPVFIKTVGEMHKFISCG